MERSLYVEFLASESAAHQTKNRCSSPYWFGSVAARQRNEHRLCFCYNNIYFIWAKWQEGGQSGRGYDYASTNEGAAINIEGPVLPFKMDGRHSQNWEFGSDWLNTTLWESIKGGTREMEIEVGMATGKSTKQAVKIDDYFSKDEIAHLTGGL